MNLGIEDPKLVLIVGSIGLGLNVLSALFLHGKCHERDVDREALS